MKHALALLPLAVAAATAGAHVTIENPTATAGSFAKVVLQVNHGCAGSATRAVTVHLPAGFLFAKARAKPGWTVAYETRALPAPLDLHGRKMESTTATVRWEGGPLANDQFDEFAVSGKLADDAAGALPFRVVQTCDKGSADWSGAPDSAEPAPLLKVTPAAAGGHAH